MFDYESYEKECERIRSVNQDLLNIFEKDLTDAGLSKKTIDSHIFNVDFYINSFLLLEDALPMEQGVRMLDPFLGDFYIHKCMWSTPANIKTTAASIKKFYKCMLACKKIEKQDYDYLCEDIKAGMPLWQEDCIAYNDPDESDSFLFF